MDDLTYLIKVGEVYSAIGIEQTIEITEINNLVISAKVTRNGFVGFHSYNYDVMMVSLMDKGLYKLL